MPETPQQNHDSTNNTNTSLDGLKQRVQEIKELEESYERHLVNRQTSDNNESADAFKNQSSLNIRLARFLYTAEELHAAKSELSNNPNANRRRQLEQYAIALEQQLGFQEVAIMYAEQFNKEQQEFDRWLQEIESTEIINPQEMSVLKNSGAFEDMDEFYSGFNEGEQVKIRAAQEEYSGFLSEEQLLQMGSYNGQVEMSELLEAKYKELFPQFIGAGDEKPTKKEMNALIQMQTVALFSRWEAFIDLRKQVTDHVLRKLEDAEIREDLTVNEISQITGLLNHQQSDLLQDSYQMQFATLHAQYDSATANERIGSQKDDYAPESEIMRELLQHAKKNPEQVNATQLHLEQKRLALSKDQAGAAQEERGLLSRWYTKAKEFAFGASEDDNRKEIIDQNRQDALDGIRREAESISKMTAEHSSEETTELYSFESLKNSIKDLGANVANDVLLVKNKELIRTAFSQVPVLAAMGDEFADWIIEYSRPEDVENLLSLIVSYDITILIKLNTLSDKIANGEIETLLGESDYEGAEMLMNEFLSAKEDYVKESSELIDGMYEIFQDKSAAEKAYRSLKIKGLATAGAALGAGYGAYRIVRSAAKRIPKALSRALFSTPGMGLALMLYPRKLGDAELKEEDRLFSGLTASSASNVLHVATKPDER